MDRRRHRIVWGGLALSLAVGSPAPRALAQDAAAPTPAAATAAPAPAAAEPAVEPRALEVLQRATRFLEAQSSFRYVSEIAYDAVQKDGEKIEFGMRRRGALLRPSFARVDDETREGRTGGIVLDGKRIVAFQDDDKVYAVADKAGSLEQQIDFVQDELDNPIAMAELLRSDLTAELTGLVLSGRYVGLEKLAGVMVEHVAFELDAVDAQLWIETGEKPLIRRVVVTYVEEEGEPQLRTDYDSWELAPTLAAGDFAFAPPAGYEKIPFAPRSKARRSAAGEATATPPGAKP